MYPRTSSRLRRRVSRPLNREIESWKHVWINAACPQHYKLFFFPSPSFYNLHKQASLSLSLFPHPFLFGGTGFKVQTKKAQADRLLYADMDKLLHFESDPAKARKKRGTSHHHVATREAPGRSNELFGLVYLVLEIALWPTRCLFLTHHTPAFFFCIYVSRSP